MTRADWLSTFAMVVFLLVVLAGCAPRTEKCYDLVAMNPLRGSSIVFNGCTGELAVSDPLPPSSTTTTIPPTAF